MNDQIPRLSRLASILTMLQSRRIVSASQIADKFNISKRTAYRDIRALEEAGVPLYTEEGRGYSLMEGYTLPPIMFSEEEANALITAHQLILKNKDHSLVKHHSEAISKITAVLKQSKKNKTAILSERIAYFANYKRESTSNNLISIQQAITDSAMLKIKYISIGKHEHTERLIEPKALYHTNENWILIAWCRLRNDYREFRIDKIQSVVRLNEKFKPRDFNLRNYFMANWSI